MTEALYLDTQARRCRKWALQSDPAGRADLLELADGYAQRARRLKLRSTQPAK